MRWKDLVKKKRKNRAVNYHGKSTVILKSFYRYIQFEDPCLNRGNDGDKGNFTPLSAVDT